VVTRLHQIQEAVRLRVEEIASAHADWPCAKGCDECCRHLAAVPRITQQEWTWIAAALDGLPSAVADAARHRIRESESATRPVICPLLDTSSGTCLVYEARPITCRAYGFYAEREYVLGCSRIASIAEQRPDLIWGNHAALQEETGLAGPAASLCEWLAMT
jgi:uncharacterized protein